MAGGQATPDEARRLYDVLTAYDVPPLMLEAGLPEFSEESKNELAALVARGTDPPPPGRLLARLEYIRTPENADSLAAAYLANLHSDDPEARKFSLYGLQDLGHPDLERFAREALGDQDAGVATAAATILLPTASEDPEVRRALQDLYAAHRDDGAFHMMRGLLEARHLDGGGDA